jgi:spermidine synthase
VSSTSPRWLPVLLLLFVGSGCAALMYELIWLQSLQLVIGSTAVSMGILLATYMGGMCLGAVAVPRVISPKRHPLRVYAALELGIGIIGVAELFLIPLFGRVYLAEVGYGLPGLLLRGVVCGVCLLPPTVLMGATLPIAARWLEATPGGVSWVGLFYSGNTAGAVFGCLLAGFYLLRVYDTVTATVVAVTLNGLVAAPALILAGTGPYIISSDRISSDRRRRVAAVGAPRNWDVYLTIALSGCCALGAEVIWTRLLSLILGATVYTFSIILAVFLLGLGIGSCAAALRSSLLARPRLMLGWCQLLLTLAIAWAAHAIQVLPYGPIHPSPSSSPWVAFQFDLLRAFWAILPAACLWGASFPLSLAAIEWKREDLARPVAGIYAANTIGAIVGALATTLWLIPAFGTQRVQQLLIALSATAAFLLLIPLAWLSRPDARRIGRLSMLASSAGLAVLLALRVAPIPGLTIAYGRYVVSQSGDAQVLYAGEGINSSVAVTRLPDGTLNFHVSGRVEASNLLTDMRLQRMLAHLPALLHPNPRSVLVVGLGAGVTAGSFVPYPEVTRIVIAEIEPLIPTLISQYFAGYNFNVVHDPRVEVIYDDGRHYISTTREKFDIITTDPIHPWVKGSAALYTKEYFELLAEHLNPGGMITQWVPLYESTTDVVKSEIATFFEVFPNGTVWGNVSAEGTGYDVVLLGQSEARSIELDGMQQRLAGHAAAARSLLRVRFGSAIDLLATYAGRPSDLAPWLAHAELNRDANLRLQYLAGMQLNSHQRQQIYDEILAFRSFPADLFVGADESKETLRKRLLHPVLSEHPAATE